MDLGLNSRAYIVTGATSGLGLATAEALVAEGASVVVSSRDEGRVAATAASLGGSSVGVAADNAAPQTPGRLIETAQSRFGRLDGALISVGGPPAGALSAISDDQWRGAFENVFLGAVRLACEVAKVLEPGGSIGLVLSSSVRSPLKNLSVSNGLRPGLAMVAKDLADEFGPRGVRVFGLVPGRILTERTKLVEGNDRGARARSEALIPLGRLGRPEEFGTMAAVLLSPAASYVSGCLIPIDGGMIRSL